MTLLQKLDDDKTQQIVAVGVLRDAQAEAVAAHLLKYPTNLRVYIYGEKMSQTARFLGLLKKRIDPELIRLKHQTGLVFTNNNDAQISIRARSRNVVSCRGDVPDFTIIVGNPTRQQWYQFMFPLLLITHKWIYFVPRYPSEHMRAMAKTTSNIITIHKE